MDAGKSIYFEITTSKSLFYNVGHTKVESVQYNDARNVTEAWRGYPKEQLFNELGWEPLNIHCMLQKLTEITKSIITNSLAT